MHSSHEDVGTHTFFVVEQTEFVKNCWKVSHPIPMLLKLEVELFGGKSALLEALQKALSEHTNTAKRISKT